MAQTSGHRASATANVPTTRPATFRALFSARRLRSTWGVLREEFRRAPARDCIDYLEFDLDLPQWLERLSGRVIRGSYRPGQPGRREVAKTEGAYRVITAPSIEDVVVFRHICDYIYARAVRSEPPGAFFSRRFGRNPLGQKLDSISDEDYADFFEVWIRYDEYRALLGLSGLYKYIVVTDISNFFDSIHHSLLIEYLAPYGVPREALGILGQLLDVLRPLAGHSSAPAIGLPQDAFDCSRTLAHLFLFEHDRRVMREVGKDAYVRWMDDQNLGVKDEVAARHAIHSLVESLGRQGLTLNAGKTRILTPAEQAEHLCLAQNKKVTAIAERIEEASTRPAAVTELELVWAEVIANRKGNWHKVAKRLLRLAGLVGTDRVTLDECKDILAAQPTLAERIFEYLIARARFDDYIALFDWLLTSGNSLYEDVEAHWFESLLVASPPVSYWAPLRRRALEFVKGTKRGTRRPWPKMPAAMLLYWLSDRRQERVFSGLLRRSDGLDGPTRRTLTAILSAISPGRVDDWLLLAGRGGSPQVSSLIEIVQRLKEGQSCFLPKKLIFVKRPSVLNRYVYDARAWLRLELLTVSPRLDVRNAVATALSGATRNRTLLETETRVAKRLRDRLGMQSPATRKA
jgi:hypothetical protein